MDGTRRDRNVDQLPGEIQVAIVVDADFGDHKARMPLAEGPSGDGYSHFSPFTSSTAAKPSACSIPSHIV